MAILGWFVKHNVQYIVKSGSSVFGCHDTEKAAQNHADMLREQGYLYIEVEEREIGEPLVSSKDDD